MKKVIETAPVTSLFSRVRRPRGSALLAVYWLIAILSLGVFATAQVLLSEVESEASDRQAFRAEQLAGMALAVAANPAVQRGDPLLRQEVSEVESFEGRILSEGGRLNLNTLLLSGNRLVVERLFELWGMERDESMDVVDALTDWVDTDDEIAGQGGAEHEDYRELGLLDRPFNKPFRTLDEALLVKGMGRVAELRPGWKDAFTLYSSGKVDLNEAGPEVIQALLNCSRLTADEFIENRNGDDGLPYTEDDRLAETPEEALALLGTGGADAEIVANLVSVGDATVRLVGIGRFGDLSVERTVVVSSRGENPAWLDHHIRRLK